MFFDRLIYNKLVFMFFYEVTAYMSKERDVHGTPEADIEKSAVGFNIDDELDIGFANETPTPPDEKSAITLRSLLTMRNLVLLVCVTTFVVCAVILIGRFFDYKRTDDIYLTLSDGLFQEVSDDPSVLSVADRVRPEASLNNYNTTLALGKSEGEVKENSGVVNDIHYARVKAKLEQIREINDDVIGWIKVDGTEINYPFAVGDDNDYYLTHAYNGEYLRSGTIFADFRCSSESVSKNYNTVLYGHNMANGAMFAGVTKFVDEQLFNESLIYVYTLDGVYVYEPFALLETKASFYYFQVGFSSDAEYEAFLTRMLDNAKLKKDVTLTADDRIISLSTCTNRMATGRYCLQARLIKVENAS